MGGRVSQGASKPLPYRLIYRGRRENEQLPLRVPVGVLGEGAGGRAGFRPKRGKEGGEKRLKTQQFSDRTVVS